MTTPIAQYLFKDNANDETGNYNGTAANVTYEAVPAGKNFGGKVAVFNGTNAKIDLPNISAVAGTNSRTFIFWARANSYNPEVSSTFFSQGTSAGFASFWAFVKNNDFNLGFDFNNFSGAGSPTTLTWDMYMVTATSNQQKIYMNGSSTAIVSATASINTANSGNAIGYYAAGNSLFYNGKIANFRIYDSVITTSEFSYLYDLANKPPSGFFMFM